MLGGELSMKRLIILCIAYPLSIISGPCWSRPEPEAIRIQAILYKTIDKNQLSEDHQNYYLNNRNEYDMGPVSTHSALDVNRITIESVTLDSAKKLASIVYYVRIGKGASGSKGFAEVNFGKSSIQAWGNDKEVKFIASYISANIEMSDK
jgi:hypothetical protein